ncbi:NAD(P)/FAD-dependent oxidoreductase [bacterium]|nr:NAD(P)/FAD-dependent oxidoreductase [bacterium]
MKPKIIVVGAGPAGLLAAGRAAQLGADVLLLEKMQRPGRKLRISGKGRCNITNTLEMPEFMREFDKKGRFLRPAFSQFFSKDILSLLAKLGVEHKVERGGRVFPASDRAQDVVDALQRWMLGTGVKMQTEAAVRDIIIRDGRIAGVVGKSEEHAANAVILCMGGASYKGTGSSGDGYAMAKTAGHSIVPIRPALVPLLTSDHAASRLQGLSLRNVEVSIWVGNKKKAKSRGEMIFTHFGVSGPLVLRLSRFAVDSLAAGEPVELVIDLKPALDHAALDRRLLRDIDAHGKRFFETLLGDLLPRKLIPVCIDASGIPAKCPAHQITGEQRKQLRVWLKEFRLKITGCRPLNEAIVTAGGVNLKEVNPKTMESRIMPGLYFAGELLDIDAPTGGYNIQAAFSTGWLAGNSAAQENARP